MSSSEDTIFGIIALGLYVAFIVFVFTWVAPPFLYLSLLVASLAVPIVFGKALWDRFGRYGSDYELDEDHAPTKRPVTDARWRNAFFVAAALLITLIHLDFLQVTIGYGLKHIGHPWAEVVHKGLTAVVIKWAPAAALLSVVREVLPNGAAEHWVVLGSALLKGATLVPLILLCRGLHSDQKDEGQPAKLAYFNRQAYLDAKAVLTWTILTLRDLVTGAVSLIFSISDGPQALLIWPLSLTALVSLIPPVLIGVAATTLFLLTYGVSSLFIWLGAMWVSLLLSSLERAVIKARSGYAKCPHATCHEAIPLPTYRCPGCSVAHDELIPGRYGVFKRECQCGEHLPTLFWFGKSRLPCECPACRKPLIEALFSDNVHVPIYGGPSSGKTMYLMSSTYSLVQNELHEVEAEIIEEGVRRRYEDRWRADFEEGRLREKTASPYPDAFLLSMRRDAGLPLSVYLYDPAGEAMETQEAMNTHGFLKYAEGIAFLIDPMTLDGVAARHQHTLAPRDQAAVSRGRPEEQLHRLVSELEAMGQLERDKQSELRIAVILSKSDQAWVASEFGLSARSKRELLPDWDDLGHDDSEHIRRWLEVHQPGLLQLLDVRFKDVRFFAVSALGQEPEQGKPFEPTRVLEPLAWLLSTRTAFTHPRLGLLWGKTLEVGAAVAVLALFIGLPTWALLMGSSLL